MNIPRTLIFLGILAASLAVQIPTALAQEEDVTDDEVNAVAKGLYCPVCENIPLDVCPTQACKQWRATIREKLGLGWSTDEIKQYFVDQYGDRVLATPPARGLNWLVYILPPVGFVAGAIFLIRAFRSWRRPLASEHASMDIPADDPYRIKLEEELRRRSY
jgi:cytochrome c-type biogenesis protein CcmH